ncbi:MAG: hypothetical protein J5585_06875 [Clostridia bacterium]|nr:hypothetical protein [Clostridia bacterium]
MKRIVSFVVILSVLIAAMVFPVEADGEARIFADNVMIYPGNRTTVYIRAEALADLGALDFSVYFDNSAITVNQAGVTGIAASTVADVNITDDSVNFSFVSTDALTGDGYIGYIDISVSSDADPGIYYMTVAVGDAYDTGLLPVTVSGCTFSLTVLEYDPQPYHQNFNVSSSVSGSYTIGDEVSVAFNTWYVSNLGTLELITEYDETVLELENISLGNQLTNAQSALWSINDGVPGYIKTSYIAPYGVTGQLNPMIEYTFTVIANVDDVSVVTLSPQNVCDTERVSMNTADVVACISLYKTVEEPVLPKISLSVVEDSAEQITLDVIAEKDTNLAAGDFTVQFDNEKLTCMDAGRVDVGMVVSNIKNDRGTVTFSFIFDGGVTDDTPVCRLVFDKSRDEHSETNVCISGNNLVNDELQSIDVDYENATVLVHDLSGKGTCTQRPTCPVCGIEFGETDPDNHDFGEWTVTTPATCTEKGEEKRSCSRCDATETREVEALGHNYEAVVTPPTCTEAGYTTHTCSRCGDSYTDTPVAALGHDWSEWTETTAPTCTAAGEKTRTCARCGETETEAIEALGHDYISETVLPTCTEEGYTTHTCSRCGNQYNDNYVSASGHKYELSKWIWTDSYESAHAVLQCGECDDSISIEAVVSEYENEGIITYIATIVFEGNEYIDNKAVYIDYTVQFIDWDGTVLSESTYHYGDIINVPNAPVREPDEKYTYSFVGWDKDITTVVGDAIYTAVYSREEKPSISFMPGDINGDGSVDNQDVVALFRYVSGGKVEVVKAALDPDGDGDATNLDVVLLFRYVSGANVELSTVPYDG